MIDLDTRSKICTRNAKTYLEGWITNVCINIRINVFRIFLGFGDLIVFLQVLICDIVNDAGSLMAAFLDCMVFVIKLSTLETSHMLSNLFCGIAFIRSPIKPFYRSMCQFTLVCVL
jgi:hypothetical protein